IGACEESVAVFRKVAASNPGYQDGLAMALNNLGFRLSEMGRHADAVGPLRESAEIYRQLAVENPAYQRVLSTVLANLANQQRHVGEPSAVAERPTKRR